MTGGGKLTASARLMEQNERLFRCPICHGAMKVEEGKSLLCDAGHRFDLAKQGYANMLTHPSKTKYDRRMFDARRMMNEAAFFEPLLVRLSEIIARRLKTDVMAERVYMLDAGCGEGSHLTDLRRKVSRFGAEDVLGVGIDISKEGVQMAARDDRSNLWYVADLAKPPFSDKSFHFILNILSPSNYAEFGRLLTDDGVLLKVIPGSGYLKELRAKLYDRDDRRAYSNEQTVELFERHFELEAQETIAYTVGLSPEQLAHLVYMTPLSWGAEEEQILQMLNDHPITEMTCEFSILTGRKKGN
ncbi:putative RNA methyltransferase [Paenibacillus sp. DMB20]|uniref:putative RNA methyltransferase n=1 Tax=Paenibacillus sp. DMB20 TaxID=1642570 RepID=UPI000627F850|nr:methyltransferase domain-containing protein [Paenibacillus sp. DMB20]KKO54096.1 hypothetical protein XI25_08405 [Paenibacillus sp. DMB20]